MAVGLSSTTPETATCPSCRALVIRAWVDGLHCSATAITLNVAGQISMLERGVELYQLQVNKARAELVFRDLFRIRSGKPALAIPAHQCPPIPGEHLDQTGQLALQQWLNGPATPVRSYGPAPF